MKTAQGKKRKRSLAKRREENQAELGLPFLSLRKATAAESTTTNAANQPAFSNFLACSDSRESEPVIGGAVGSGAFSSGLFLILRACSGFCCGKASSKFAEVLFPATTREVFVVLVLSALSFSRANGDLKIRVGITKAPATSIHLVNLRIKTPKAHTRFAQSSPHSI